MNFLSLGGLEKQWPDGTHAVRGINLAVEEGQLVVLLGPSGCGKTTTLRMVAGLELPSAGQVVIEGRNVTKLPPSRRDVGFVFQFYALYPHLSVEENIAFPLECARVPRAERDAAVRRVAERLDLVDLLPRRPRALSGGDQQRVGLARAMVRKPKAWLMDEPLGSLDAARRAEMCELIRAQQLADRVTTLYVTHDQEEAMRLADRVVVMSEGEIVQCDTPREVYDTPANLFVARFVGSPGMNLVEGRLRRGDFHVTGTVEGADPRRGIVLPLEAVCGSIGWPDGDAVLGVRPEHVRIDPSGELRGKVVLDAYAGAWRHLHVAGPWGRIVAQTPPRAGSAEGEEVVLTLAPEGVRMFDAASGRRMT